eukprot:545487-Rhodomonas_salina.1
MVSERREEENGFYVTPSSRSNRAEMENLKSDRCGPVPGYPGTQYCQLLGATPPRTKSVLIYAVSCYDGPIGRYDAAAQDVTRNGAVARVGY